MSRDRNKEIEKNKKDNNVQGYINPNNNNHTTGPPLYIFPYQHNPNQVIFPYFDPYRQTLYPIPYFPPNPICSTPFYSYPCK